MIAASLLAASAQAAVTFNEILLTSGDTGTDSTVSGDFNGDGILDLVTVNASTLSFYEGLGGGQFAAPVSQALAQNLGAVFAADFNGDGALDLAIAGAANSAVVTILLGNGDGTFRQGTNVTVSGYAAAITLADFNGDHKPDIAVSDGTNYMTWVFLGNGDGTFKLSQTEYYGGNTIVSGDFNGDGKQDLVFASSTNVGLFLGKGNGTFSQLILAPLSDVDSLAVGDFYDNRIQSLAAVVTVPQGAEINDNYIYTLRYAKGQLYVENQNLFQKGGAVGNWAIAAGDLNGDFKVDLYFSGGFMMTGGLSDYMLGNGDGTFRPMKTAANPIGTNTSTPFIRDLNLDSRHDVGAAWNSDYDEFGGGAEVLINTNAIPNCDPPPANALSVHVCAPQNGETVGSTFTFKAAGNAFNGIAKRMELWIDGTLVSEYLEDQLKATVSLSAGQHTATFVVVDTFDSMASTSVNFTAE
ncbi:MAG TPA: VCBS repeat-containing protein [Terriglobales bacterium]|nr:VCBS repeat-containing protein [Terriglobales bacterium]